MPKHIVNLLLLLSIFLLLAFAAKIYFTDPSFYQYGHYRADAVPEIAADIPLYRGAEYCQTCHDERLTDWPAGSHSTVQCEVCHGTNRGHPDDGKTMTPADTIKLCSYCHEALPTRPAWQPQIVLAGHPFADEETDQCQSCHDPHMPGDDEPGAPAPATGPLEQVQNETHVAQPAAVKKCAKCHGKQGEGRRKNPALAGLDAAVFIERMNMYVSGARENKKMAKAAKSFASEEIEELARYYESLPAPPPENPD